MGNPGAVTPYLDGLAGSEAVSFSSAFCQNPVCTPSRCSFMTGWYPHVAGHRTMYHMLRPHEPILLKTLLRAGYYVWWGGKNDLVPGETGYGDYCTVKYRPPRAPARKNPHAWDEWRGEPLGDKYYSFYLGRLDHDPASGRYDDFDWAMVNGAIELIRNAPAGKPLCIYLPLGYPHPPYAVEEPYYGMVDPRKVPRRIPSLRNWEGKPSLLSGIAERQGLHGWSEERWRELRRTYLGMCARLDHQFGLIVEALREAGMYYDTALFLFSDHGDFTGDYGLVEKTQNTFEDCLTRVPFIVKPPAGVPVAPRISDALVELIDMPATVEAVAGVSPGYTHFGRSLLPVLAGATDEHRDAVFCEGGRLAGETHCAEYEPDKYGPGNLYWPRVGLQARLPEHGKALMCRTRDYKYVARLFEADELYELKSDPGETRNRAADPALAPVLARMKERVLRFFEAHSHCCAHMRQDHEKRN